MMRYKSLVTSALIVGLLALFSRIAGLVKEIAMADRLGATSGVDAYLIASLPIVFVTIITMQGGLNSGLLPVFSKYSNQTDKTEFWKLISNLLNITTVFLTAISVLLMLLSPFIIPFLTRGMEPQVRLLTVKLSVLLAPAVIFIGFTGISTGVCHKLENFAYPAWGSFIFNIVIFLAILFLGKRFGTGALVLGTIVGAIGQVIIFIPFWIREGAMYTPGIRLNQPEVREIIKLMLPAVLNLLVVSASIAIIRFLGAKLPWGSLACFNFAERAIAGSAGVLYLVIFTVVFPRFSNLAAEGNMVQLERTLYMAQRMFVFFAVPLIVILVILRKPIVQILFERGAFTKDATETVSAIIPVYAFSILGAGLVGILNRFFYALKKNLIPLKVSIVSLALSSFLAWVLLDRFGIRGLAFASVSFWTFCWLGTLFSLPYYLPGYRLRADIVIMAKMGLAGAVTGMILKSLSSFPVIGSAGTFAMRISWLLLMLISCFLLYFLVTFIFKLEEPGLLFSEIKSRVIIPFKNKR